MNDDGTGKQPRGRRLHPTIYKLERIAEALSWEIDDLEADTDDREAQSRAIRKVKKRWQGLASTIGDLDDDLEAERSQLGESSVRAFESFLWHLPFERMSLHIPTTEEEAEECLRRAGERLDMLESERWTLRCYAGVLGFALAAALLTIIGVLFDWPWPSGAGEWAMAVAFGAVLGYLVGGGSMVVLLWVAALPAALTWGWTEAGKREQAYKAVVSAKLRERPPRTT